MSRHDILKKLIDLPIEIQKVALSGTMKLANLVRFSYDFALTHSFRCVLRSK